MEYKDQDNIYLHTPLSQVKTDALHGVSAARTAWRLRDPDDASRALGYVVGIELNRQSRVIEALDDFLAGKLSRQKRRRESPKDVHDMRIRLGMNAGPGGEEKSSEPMPDIYGNGEPPESDDIPTTGNNAADSDDSRTEKNFQDEEIPLDKLEGIAVH